MKTVAIIQARMGSSRLPGKVLEDLAGIPVLAWVVRAAAAIPGVDAAVVATTDQPGDDALAAWCDEQGVACHRGSETDVLDRYLMAAHAEQADVVVRMTSDCPLHDPQICGQIVLQRRLGDHDYASNVEPRSWPDGMDCDAFTLATLEATAERATDAADREHVTTYVRANPALFGMGRVICPVEGLADERWTLDTAEDLAFIRAIAERLPRTDVAPSWLDIMAILEAEPELRRINRPDWSPTPPAPGQPPAGDQARSNAKLNYARSNALLARAEAVIPLGSQTFSKSHIAYPQGAAPLFVTHGKGARTWDVDGNEFIDLVIALMPNVLGYADGDVNSAVRAQLERGVTFSLATELEIQLAEKLVELIPCAEMVRFGKNGTDATSAAIRLARAYTGRDRVAVCGYHGWQDWYIGSTVRNKGVPGAVSDLTTAFTYNDPDTLEELFSRHPGQYAAVIMEPMNIVYPESGFLERIRDLAHDHGAVLVFDETVTGFRFHLGGAQALFGVTPDLATFGKSMANGFPISAIVGKREIMMEMEEIFFSSTFGGETLSITAALATIEKMQRLSVLDTIHGTGQAIMDGVAGRIADLDMADIVSISGHPSWSILSFKDAGGDDLWSIKTLFLQEMLARGILTNGTHNISYALSAADVEWVLAAYDAVLPLLRAAVRDSTLADLLKSPPMKPIFKVR